jgi:hypothetical protein
MTRLLVMGKAMLLAAVLETTPGSTKLLAPLLQWRLLCQIEPEPP